MPVTAKLSKQFYDNLGEGTANELMEWFNQVDDTYRTQLKELNELNFQRFDAKLEQRLAESDARWNERMVKMDAQMAEFRSDMKEQFAESDARWSKQMGELKVELIDRMAKSDVEWERRFAANRASLIKWMFVFWIGTAGWILTLRGF